jgi:hypothetical protein
MLIRFIYLINIVIIYAFAGNNVILCGDVFTASQEAKLVLHEVAQQRAQKEIENFVGKKLIQPYWGKKDIEMISGIIETYWCETSSTPLHSAYYRLYSSSKFPFQAESFLIFSIEEQENK